MPSSLADKGLLLWAAALLLGVGTGAAGCAGPGEPASPPSVTSAAAPAPESPRPVASTSPLADTEWRLLEIQSMDDAIGTKRPQDPSAYTMRLKADGTVAMRLNCNSATGTWSAEAARQDSSSGRFEFGPLAGTLAVCPAPSLDEQVAAQATYVRSYLLKDGRLYLSLFADGGIFVWEPHRDVPFLTTPDTGVEAAILEASPSYTKAGVDIEGGTGRARYVYGRVDLNGDGRDEVFVYLLGSFFCGTGGCNLLLFTSSPGGYVLMNEFTTARLPVIVTAERIKDWPTLVWEQSGGGAVAAQVRYTFDGRRYVRGGRLPLDQAIEGRRYLAGELTFEKGIPLAPVR